MSFVLTPSAIYIAIGDDLVSCKRTEQNRPYLINALNDNGIVLKEIRIILGNANDLSDAIVKTKSQYDFVFLAGEVDGRERSLILASIAMAFDADLILDGDLLNKIKKKYPLLLRNKHNRSPEMQMAYVPSGARIVEHDSVDTPAIVMGNVCALPGDSKAFEIMAQQVCKIFAGQAAVLSHSVVFEASENKIKDILESVSRRYKDVKITIHPFITRGSLGSEITLRSEKKAMLGQAIDTLQKMVALRMSSGGNTKRNI